MKIEHSIQPEEVLKTLLSKQHRRDKEDKLQRLHKLCSLEYGRGANRRDLSLSNMSKIAESDGLFRARTIYNVQSEDYRTLIHAWDSFTGKSPEKIASRKIEGHKRYDFLQKIEDPAVRSLCQIGLMERDKFLAELNMVKSETEIVIDMRPAASIPPNTGADLLPFADILNLTESELRSLESAIDPSTWSERQWRLGTAGEVVDRHERFIFLPGFVTAISKILGRAADSSMLSNL